MRSSVPAGKSTISFGTSPCSSRSARSTRARSAASASGFRSDGSTSTTTASVPRSTSGTPSAATRPIRTPSTCAARSTSTGDTFRP